MGACGGTRATDAEPMSSSGASKAEVQQDAPGATALPALRAKTRKIDRMDGMLREAKYDNAEFYRIAIKNLQSEIYILRARTTTAAAAVRFHKE